MCASRLKPYCINIWDFHLEIGKEITWAARWCQSGLLRLLVPSGENIWMRKKWRIFHHFIACIFGFYFGYLVKKLNTDIETEKIQIILEVPWEPLGQDCFFPITATKSPFASQHHICINIFLTSLYCISSSPAEKPNYLDWLNLNCKIIFWLNTTAGQQYCLFCYGTISYFSTRNFL